MRALFAKARGYALATLVVVSAEAAAIAIHGGVPPAGLAPVFLIAIMLAAAVFGTGLSIFVAVVLAGLYPLFIPPLASIAIALDDDVRS